MDGSVTLRRVMNFMEEPAAQSDPTERELGDYKPSLFPLSSLPLIFCQVSLMAELKQKPEGKRAETHSLQTSFLQQKRVESVSGGANR